MNCVSCNEAVVIYRKTGELPGDAFAHAQQCQQCHESLAEAIRERLEIRQTAARDMDTARGVERARLLFMHELGMRTPRSIADLGDWVAAQLERIVGFIQHFDLGLVPEFAGVMGEPGRVRVFAYDVNLGSFSDTGWEAEGLLRVGPQSVELLLKPTPNSDDAARLQPRMAFYGRTGELILPDATQMSRPDQGGYHAFTVWQGDEGDRIERLLALPLQAEMWFVAREDAAQH